MRNISNRIKKLETMYPKTTPTIIFIDFMGKTDRDKKKLFYKCDDIVFENNTTMEDLENRIIKQCEDNGYGMYMATSCNKDGTC